MFPPAFEYTVPQTLNEALTVVAQRGDEAKPLAGGQSLIPLLKLRLVEAGTGLAVVKVPWKKSTMGITRSPCRLRATTLAPRASITEPQSPAGSAWASDPPRVPMLRISGSAICGAAAAIVG